MENGDDEFIIQGIRITEDNVTLCVCIYIVITAEELLAWMARSSQFHPILQGLNFGGHMSPIPCV